MAAFLWDLHVAAVAADNPSLRVWPPGSLVDDADRATVPADPVRMCEYFLHFSLLPLLGLPIGELFDLDALADDCAADGIHEFQFTSAPLRLRAGAGSPANALAVK